MSPYVFWFPWFDVRYDFLIKTIFVSFACSCLYDGSCLIYVVCVCLYDGSCLIYVVCMMAHVLFTLFVWWLMSYLRCLYDGSCLIYVVCVCLRILVSNTYCVVFFFVLCGLFYQFLWTVHFWLPLQYSLMFINIDIYYGLLLYQHTWL